MRNPRPSNVMLSIIMAITTLFTLFAIGALINHFAKNFVNEQELGKLEQTNIQA
ncbi:hypothetical protein [Scytonema millei]|uniref:Uncharacterized protein n=1 Tax=Scytonema millei VB511283 TaxID=1245923 RepID=A0A9X5E8P1_9CYAN|nr:hypothetical protein [Scytonema millei]NHC37375.1 hypothetical protein [Scytonema millei VB511283]